MYHFHSQVNSYKSLFGIWQVFKFLISLDKIATHWLIARFDNKSRRNTTLGYVTDDSEGIKYDLEIRQIYPIEKIFWPAVTERVVFIPDEAERSLAPNE